MYDKTRACRMGICRIDVSCMAGSLARRNGPDLETAPLKRQLSRYGVVTLHRPSNVDDGPTLSAIAGALKTVAAELPLVFPVHPRTRANLERLGIDLGPYIHLMGPQAYMSFLNLWKDAVLVLTDSGGLQEETTALGVPCVTIRENTERPITVDEGSNTLAGTDPARITKFALDVIQNGGKRGQRAGAVGRAGGGADLERAGRTAHLLTSADPTHIPEDRALCATSEDLRRRQKRRHPTHRRP